LDIISLIALMLGRLGMTVDQCISAWPSACKTIFDINIAEKTQNLFNTNAAYSDKHLTEAVDVIADHFDVPETKRCPWFAHAFTFKTVH
jgi:hypothetical protein